MNTGLINQFTNGTNLYTYISSTDVNDNISLGGHNIEFAGRYLNHLAASHSALTQEELDILEGNNMQVYSIYQDTVPDDLNYFTTVQGQYDAIVAIKMAADIGQPDHKPIYFAVDRPID